MQRSRTLDSVLIDFDVSPSPVRLAYLEPRQFVICVTSQSGRTNLHTGNTSVLPLRRSGRKLGFGVVGRDRFQLTNAMLLPRHRPILAS